jgi:hypothetical protein
MTEAGGLRSSFSPGERVLARLLVFFTSVTATAAFAASQRELGGGFGCCSLFLTGLLASVYRSGGVDWGRTVGTLLLPGVFGWFIWRDRAISLGARVLALVSALLQVLSFLVGLGVALFGPHLLQAATARVTGAQDAPRFSKPVDLASVKEDPTLGLHPPATITTDPPGARVFIDGKERGVAPLETSLEAGRRQEIRVELDGYFPAQQARSPNARERLDLRFTLQAAARLEVKTTPPGARVYVGRRLVLAATPGLTGPLEAGETAVLVLGEGAVPVAMKLPLEVGTRPLELELPPGVKVSVTTKPEGADVLLDGQWLGVSPTDVFVSPKGRHTLEVQKAPFAPAKRLLTAVKRPTRVDLVLVDVERLALSRSVEKARARYDALNATLEKAQDKFEHTEHPTAKQEQQLDAMEREMTKAATALEEAEGKLKDLLELRAKDSAAPPPRADGAQAPTER